LGEYEKAVEYYEKIVSEWPDYKFADIAQCLVGDYLQKLMNSGKLSPMEAEPRIEQAYLAVIENYADSSSAATAYLRMAQIS